MKKIRYLSLLVLLLGSISIWGQENFNPSSPPDPGQPPMRLDIIVTPSEAGSVSGSGRYAAGAKVNLYAYVNTGFRFVNWTNSAGEEISTSKNFQFTKGEGHEKLTANYEFDPSNPSEPDDPANVMYYQLQLNATEGGSVSGAGRYLANKSITLHAYPESKFDFVGWYDVATGDELSTETYFTYTTTAKHRVLEARFKFNPDSPSEPTEPIVKRTVTATATEGGTTNFSSNRVLIGNTIEFYAYPNSGYDFVGWYLNGELYTALRNFSYTVTDSYYQNFEARFVFNPNSPVDPGMPTQTRHSIYIMNKVTKPGTTVQFPIYLSSVKKLKDMTFQLEFPECLTPDFDNVVMSEKAIGYKISYTKNEGNNYVFTLKDGEIEAGNAALLVFTIQVGADIVTAQNYPIKINLVEVTEEDNTVVTASTRNGRLSVYKLGDTNGDDAVDALDIENMVTVSLEKTSDTFIKEVSDLNEDGEIDAQDVLGISEIVLKEEEEP